MKGRNLLGLHPCDDFFAEEEMWLTVYRKGGGESKHPPRLESKCALGFAKCKGEESLRRAVRILVLNPTG